TGAANDGSDLPIRIADIDHWPADRSHAVELARHDQPLGLRPQRDQVHVGGAEALRKRLAWLVVHEGEVQLAPPCFGLEFTHPHTAADEYKSNPAAGAKELRGPKDRFVFVDAAHVTGVRDHEAALEPPLLTNDALLRRGRAQRPAVGPVGDHAQPLLGYPAPAQH